MYKWCRSVVVVAAGVTIGAAAYLSLSATEGDDSDSDLVVEWPGPDLGEIATGRHVLVVKLRNNTKQPKRLLGMMKQCGWNCCNRPLHEEQVIVKPGSTVAVPFELDVKSAGQFETRVVLFAEGRKLREVAVTLVGIGTARTQN